MLLDEVDSREVILCLWCQWIFEETFSQSSHTRLLTEFSDKKKSEWKTISIRDFSDKLSNEIDLILNKNCGSNAYLLRGISSIRAALAMIFSYEDRTAMIDSREKVEIFSVNTGLSPKKDELIIDTRVGIRSVNNGALSKSTLPIQEINSENLKISLGKIKDQRIEK